MRAADGVERPRKSVTCEIPTEALGDVGSEGSFVAPFRVERPPGERFRDEGEIARGGMGTVRRVHDCVLNREVAMKVSDPCRPDPTLTAMRCVEEAQITGQLDHPNIVPVYELGVSAEGPAIYFTMKLVDGETLTRFIASMHAVPYSHVAMERALHVFLKICDAVSFAHSRGVVHRDLKPENVMVGSHGQVYVMDWGVAQLLDGHRIEPTLQVTLPEGTRAEDSGAIVGTFDYMASEQAWGRTLDIDERTDVYGLGGILYHLLTGRGPNAAPTPFDALQKAQRGEIEAPASRGAWSELPPGLCTIAQRALAREPSARYQTVSELASEVEDFLRGGGWFETLSFAAGETIVTQGEAGDSAYIIASGTCEVSKGTGEERRVLRTLGQGEVFGETAVLTGGHRTATVTAVDAVTVKVVTRDALEREFGRHSWSGAFVRALAERFREVDEQLSELRR